MASLFLLLASLLAFSCSCQADLISDICSKAVNPKLCIQTLSSDPRSRGANAVSLGLIAVAKSEAATQDFIKVVTASSTEKTKGIVSTCVKTSKDAIDDLKQVAQALKSYSPVKKSDIQTKGSAALTNVGTCDDEFGAAEPPRVKVASKKAQDVIGILLAVANAL